MTLPDFERQHLEWAERASRAQASAAHAYERLVTLALASDTGQARRVAGFVAATFDGDAFALDPFDLRAVDVAVSDDMLCCLDALRWGKAALHELIPDGRAKVLKLIAEWGLAGKPLES